MFKIVMVVWLISGVIAALLLWSLWRLSKFVIGKFS